MAGSGSQLVRSIEVVWLTIAWHERCSVERETVKVSTLDSQEQRQWRSKHSTTKRPTP